MAKIKKSRTKTAGNKTSDRQKTVVSHRKNTSASTRAAGRQRSGNNGPQQGSH